MLPCKRMDTSLVCEYVYDQGPGIEMKPRPSDVKFPFTFTRTATN